MKLDPRIKDILYIADCFTTDNYQKYVGTECYMTDFIDRFRDLSMCKKAVLTKIADGLDTPYVSDEDYFRFCLASVFVEEKPKEKFIPFRYLKELADAGIEVGKVISIRNKNYDAVVANVLVTEINYNPTDAEVIDITLGATGYEFPTLLNSYMLQVDGEWKPFGVEE